MRAKEDIMATTMFDPRDEDEQIINYNTNIMSELKVTGIIKKILPVETGVSKADKEWKKQGFILDTGAQYNPEICFNVFGAEKVENLTKYNKEGDSVEVHFNVSSREYEGKYFHNVDAWRIEKVGATNTPDAGAVDESGGDGEGNLPF